MPVATLPLALPKVEIALTPVATLPLALPKVELALTYLSACFARSALPLVVEYHPLAVAELVGWVGWHDCGLTAAAELAGWVGRHVLCLAAG